MQESRYAVIDLGTNTFHLLAMEAKENGDLVKLHKERAYIRLAENGIETIGDAPFQRGIMALKKFRGILDDLGIKHLRAFGTAALRTASNSDVFIQEAKKQTDIKIEIISGIEEARLIHQGVLQAIPKQDERIVIMDIGGGSVEFIIADDNQVLWSASFQIGVAVLYKAFHHSSPISEDEVKVLRLYLTKALDSFFQAMDTYEAKVLVGASGTFDVLGGLMPQLYKDASSAELDMSQFSPLYQRIVSSTLEERLQMDGIPEARADMMVVALILIQVILENTNIETVVTSSYAMKEGILKELILNENNLIP